MPMQIGNEIIIIPQDDPVGYMPNWRCRIGRALIIAKQICPIELAADPFLKACRRHLQLTAHNIRPVNIDEHECIRRVLAWHDNEKSEFRLIIEALLLTAAPFDAIAADIGISADDVKMYERLCFNVRDDQGQMILGDVQRIMIAQQDLNDEQGLKLMAVRGSYEMLCNLIGINTPHWKEAPDVKIHEQILQTSRVLLYRNLILGKYQSKDLAAIETNDLKRQQIMVLTKQPEDAGKTDSMDAFGIQLLQALAPKMMETALKDEEMAKQNEALKNKLQVQKEINNTPIVDNGVKVGASIINDGISKRFADG